MVTTEKAYRSVSQLKQYERCPHSWYLARVLKSWSRPAAWLPQGSAVHTVAEHIERRKLAADPLDLEQAQDLFRSEYANEVAKYTEVTPNFEYWFKSGPYGGAVDVERRYEIGLGQVEKFMRWDEAHPEEVIWVAPDGTPGIELAFEIELDGIPVRGYIDAIVVAENGDLIVRDYKTGNSPGDDFQLGVYGVAIAETYAGVSQPVLGDYWMARSGKPTYPFDLRDWTRERVSQKFQELDENIRLERFDPLPEASKCNFCDVALACKYREG